MNWKAIHLQLLLYHQQAKEITTFSVAIFYIVYKERGAEEGFSSMSISLHICKRNETEITEEFSSSEGGNSNKRKKVRDHIWEGGRKGQSEDASERTLMTKVVKGGRKLQKEAEKIECHKRK